MLLKIFTHRELAGSSRTLLPWMTNLAGPSAEKRTEVQEQQNLQVAEGANSDWLADRLAEEDFGVLLVHPFWDFQSHMKQSMPRSGIMEPS